ncbi:MAG: hypothetical protein EOO74_01960, partial [Myxococcales bacterium]
MSTLLARALRRLGLFSVLALGVACSTAADPEPDDEPGDSDPGINDERLVTRWSLPASVAKAGAQYSVEYDNPPSWNKGKNCSGTFTSGAKELGYHIKTNFSKVTSVGGYSCRQNTANKSQTSVHGTGRAIDIMIKPVNGKANSAAGDAIANWLVTHADEIGVQYVIWNRTAWNIQKPAFTQNPYWNQYESYNTDQNNRYFGNAGLTYKINDWLSADVRVFSDYLNHLDEVRSAKGFFVGSYAKRVAINNET